MSTKIGDSSRKGEPQGKESQEKHPCQSWEPSGKKGSGKQLGWQTWCAIGSSRFQLLFTRLSCDNLAGAPNVMPATADVSLRKLGTMDLHLVSPC